MIDPAELVTAALVAGLVAAGALAIALRSGRLRDLLADHPNDRSLHVRVTPRFGGLGLMAGVLLALCPILPHLATMGRPPWAPIWLGLCVVLAGVSALDDRRPLSPAWRLLAQSIVASLWTAVFLSPDGLTTLTSSSAWAPSPLWAIVLIPGLIWSMNLYNFMDGADGMAGSMAVIGFSCFALAAWAGAVDLPASRQAGATGLALCSVVLAAASAGFLLHNFPPAKVFMGDAGSIPLGFSAAALGMIGVRLGLWSPLWPFIVFFPFILDATLTLGRRLLRGEAVWRPHREHLYQRYILAGHSHRQMTIRALAIMLICATPALLVAPGVAFPSRNFAIRIETLIIALQFVAGLVIARRIGR